MKSASRHALLAGFLGWTLDAFDFFVVVFLLDVLAAQFGVPKRIVNTLTATLLFRPVGAVIFGMLADRYGRRIPLMANVIYFSIIELFSGFSQTYTQFLVLRVLFGIGLEANGVLVRRLRWSRRRANGEECCRASSRAD